MRASAVLAGLLPALALAQVEPDPAKVELKVQRVQGSVYVIDGAGGNIGVSVGPDGIVVVDDQYAPLARRSRPR